VRVALALSAFIVGACASPAAVATSAPPSAAGTSAATASPARPPATPTPSPTPTPVPKVPAITDSPVQTGLRIPWDLAFAPDGRMFVTERIGNVLIFESGATNGLLYVCASRIDQGEWRNQVLRLKATGNEVALDGFVIRTGMRAAVAHDGCTLRFGPDRKLWVSMGESTIGSLAQNVTSLNGKILRVNTDGSIPADNPVLPGRSEPSAIWSYGHRNPQGITFQQGTGAVFEVEHGEDIEDEINVLEKGANYGWPIVEGPDPSKRFKDPVWSSGPATIANSGATFVTGTMWGTWSGSLFIAQLKEADLRRYVVEGTKVTPAEILLNGKYGRLRSPVLGPDGALYVTTSNGSGDRIVRVAATQPP